MDLISDPSMTPAPSGNDSSPTAIDRGCAWKHDRPRPDDIPSSLDQRMTGTSTHLRVWPCCHSFIEWAGSSAGSQALSWAQAPKLRLLELGSGRGWLGLVIRDSFPGLSNLVLTELPDIVPGLEAEIAEAVRLKSAGALLQVCPLDWWTLKMPDQAQEASQAESARHLLEEALPESLAAFDCAFGVDLCWNEYTCDALATALLAFALSSSHMSETAPCVANGSIREESQSAQGFGGPKVVYAHWNRSDRITRYLLSTLHESGLQVRVMHPDDWSPGPGTTFDGLLVTTTPDDVSVLAASLPDSDADDGGSGSSWDEDANHMDEILGDLQENMPHNPIFFVFEITAAAGSSRRGSSSR